MPAFEEPEPRLLGCVYWHHSGEFYVRTILSYQTESIYLNPPMPVRMRICS